MTVLWLDHINIRTANLAALTRFYEAVLSLELGERPPFDSGGAWLYCADKAVVHLVEVDEQPAGHEPRLEHFAFMASELADFIAMLREHKIPYEVAIIPETNNRQVHLRDPDGNHIEMQFAANEQADLSNFDG